MRTSTFRTVGIAVATVALALVTACGGDDDKTTSNASKGSGGSASQTPAAKDTLAAAVKDLGAGTYSYSMKIPEGTFTGSIDPTGKQQVKVDGVAAGGLKYTIEGIALGADYYFKTSIPTTGVNAKKWYKLDRSKIKKDAIIGLIETKDPTASQGVLARVTTATQPDPATITGTYDLTGGGDLGIDDAAVLQALGDKAKSAPFTATLDGKHLVSLKITVPAYGTVAEQTLTVDYTGHSQPVTVAAPKAADVLAAPAAVYGLLNG
ncbi:hypothetical protein [Dactylosporangium sp. NPDC005555]|uniref:hypothetical protein n=1 Tax=Dactylosporangium sp. NPDC005555 TaxID=3154889 RepID=UPI0033B0CE31